MNCPKCGGNMEKGCISLFPGRPKNLYYRTPLRWYCDKTIKKYAKSINWLCTKPDYKIYGKRSFIGDERLESYRCENCGTIIIIPPDNDSEKL